MVEYEVQPYSAEYEADFIRLFAEEGFVRTPAQLSWIFSPPSGPGLAVIARRESSREIVGVMGMIPMQLWVGGATRLSHLLVDLVVDPSCRGAGLFRGLAEAAYSFADAQGSACVWGFPNEAAAVGWFNRYGWIPLGSPPLLMRPLRSGFLARRLAPWLGWFDIPLKTRRTAPPPGVRQFDGQDQEADFLWAEFSKRIECGAVRDSAWLNWRLLDRPGLVYRTVAGLDDAGAIRVLVSTSMGEREGMKILYVMEAISRSPDDDLLLRSVLESELALAVSKGAEVAFCWSAPSAPNRKIFRSLRFLPVPKALRPTQTYFGVRPLSNFHDSARNPGSWYVSYTDLDTV